MVIGLVEDEAALEEYMTAPFHVRAIALWREISDWVIADVREARVGEDADGAGAAPLRLGAPERAEKAVV